MRIPGLGRFNKTTGTYIGKLRRAQFEKFIYTDNFKKRLNIKLAPCHSVNLELVTFANSANFPDLILSILSFINSSGIPAKWTIYADDEISEFQKNIFNSFDFVVCKDWFNNVSVFDKEKYQHKWQFRKYLSLSTHQFSSTTIFLDSDVLFYGWFNKYKEVVKESNWYLPEPADAFSIDIAITKRNEYNQDMFIINSGFMILNHLPPWNTGMQYLADCLSNNSVTHFSEQSAVNIVYKNDRFSKIFDPRIFHVSTVDHFKLGVLDTSELAVRHYVGPIRYKMWQAGWKQYI